MLYITLTAIKVGPTTEDVPVSLVIGPIIVVLVIGISILVIFMVLKRRRYIIFFCSIFFLKNITILETFLTTVKKVHAYL